MAIALPASGIGRVTGVIFENRGYGTLTLLGARLVCFTAPSTNPLDVDINLLATGDTDPNAAGTTILSTHPTNAASAYRGTDITSFATPALAVGEAWVFDVDDLNGADGIVLILKVERS